MSLTTKIINKLSDAYNKNPHSNISKVISVIVSEFEVLKDTFERIESWRAIDKAEGQTLDDIGIDVKQHRGDSSDEIYRVLLKSKRARDLSEGDTNTIINILAMSIDANKEDIKIKDLWHDEDDPEPNAIKIVNLPIEKLNLVGMSSKQFSTFVAATVAAGVAVQSIDFQGTFEYGAIDEEYDEEKGFADVEQTFGGFYGAVYQLDDERDLPV